MPSSPNASSADEKSPGAVAPLAGIRVVELASFVAAPAGGALLADLGAEVIKVEVPQGEVYRYSRPKFAGVKSDFPEAPQFHMDNRGKRSLALDLGADGADEVLRRVIDGADVLLTNMLPGRLERFRLDPTSLRKRRPELICALLSGYGPEGPEASTPAFDYTAFWARTGFMHQLHEPDASPAFLRPGTGDHAASLSLVTGILAALRIRDQTGQGQVIDVNLLHMGFYIQGNDAAIALATGENPQRHDRRRPRNPLWCQYQTGDGRWLFLVMIESERYWPALCEAVERPGLATDERFADPIARYRNSETLTEILGAVFASRSLVDWEAQLGKFRLIWSPVKTLVEGTNDPQAALMGVFPEVEHPRAGRFRTVAPPMRMSGYPMPEGRLGPELGADTEAILFEAGLSDEEVARVLAANARNRADGAG